MREPRNAGWREAVAHGSSDGPEVEAEERVGRTWTSEPLLRPFHHRSGPARRTKEGVWERYVEMMRRPHHAGNNLRQLSNTVNKKNLNKQMQALHTGKQIKDLTLCAICMRNS